MHKKEAKGITVSAIHDLTGLSEDVIRRHQREGWFDLHDLRSTIKYVNAQMDLTDLQVRMRTEERGDET